MIEIIIATRAAMALTAFLVSIISGRVVYEKLMRKERDKTFRFALAIMLGWLGHLLFSIMFFSGRYAVIDHRQADQNGWTVPLVTVIIIIGGIMHIQNLTSDNHGRLYQYAAMAISLVGLITYWRIIT